MERSFTFVLTETQANLILEALQPLPYRVVAPLVTAMQQQAAYQIQQSAAVSRDETSPED